MLKNPFLSKLEVLLYHDLVAGILPLLGTKPTILSGTAGVKFSFPLFYSSH